MGEWLSIEGAIQGIAKFGTDDLDTTYLYTPPRAGRFSVPVQRFHIFNWDIQNRSGGSATALGVGVHFAPGDWKMATWSNVTSAFTDVTATIQAGTGTVALETPGTNSDGYVVAAVRPFNVYAVNLGTQCGGGSNNVTRDLRYSTTSGWTAITNAYVAPPTGTPTWSTGERAICFPTPGPDWAPMTTAVHGTGVPAGLYGIFSRSTVAPASLSTAATASQVTVGRMADMVEGTADNGTFSKGSDFPIELQGAHLALLISQDTATANVANAAGTHGSIAFRLLG